MFILVSSRYGVFLFMFLFQKEEANVTINNVRISKYVQQDFVKAQSCMMKYFGAKVTKSWTKKNLWMTAFKNFEGA